MKGRKPNTEWGTENVDSRYKSEGALLARAHQGVIVVLLARPIVSWAVVEGIGKGVLTTCVSGE